MEREIKVLTHHLAVSTGVTTFLSGFLFIHVIKMGMIFTMSRSASRLMNLVAYSPSHSSDNSLQLSVYPKDALLIDGETSLPTRSPFWLRDRLAELAQQSDDLLTFERQQIIGDRVADTHLLEAASARHRVGLCLPTEEWVDAGVFFEKVSYC